MGFLVSKQERAGGPCPSSFPSPTTDSCSEHCVRSPFVGSAVRGKNSSPRLEIEVDQSFRTQRQEEVILLGSDLETSAPAVELLPGGESGCLSCGDRSECWKKPLKGQIVVH